MAILGKQTVRAVCGKIPHAASPDCPCRPRHADSHITLCPPGCHRSTDDRTDSAGRPRAIEGDGVLQPVRHRRRTAADRIAGAQGRGGMGTAAVRSDGTPGRAARAVRVRPRLGVDAPHRRDGRAALHATRRLRRGLVGANRRRDRSEPVFIGDQTADQVEALKGTLKGAIVLTQPLQTGFVRADRAAAGDERRAPCASARRQCRPPADRRRINGASPKSCATPALARSSAAEHRRAWDDVRPREPRRGRSGQPSIILAAEHYNMIARMLAAARMPVKLRVDMRARYLDAGQEHLQRDRRDSRNRSAAERRDRAVGAHLDSWHSVDRAQRTTPTASPAVLEAVRILKALGAAAAAARCASRCGAARSRDCSVRAPR